MISVYLLLDWTILETKGFYRSIRTGDLYGRMLEVETSQLVTCFLVIHIFQVWILFEDGLCHFWIIFTDHFAADTDPFPVLSSGGYFYVWVLESLLINALLFSDVKPEFFFQ